MKKKNIKETNLSQEDALHTQAKEILDFLNKKTRKNFRYSDSNIYLIIDILKTGVSVIDCRGVIARKFRDWKDDKKSAEWLRPKTLFNPLNFDQYLGELVVPEECNLADENNVSDDTVKLNQ